jgi:hypothetical protein
MEQIALPSSFLCSAAILIVFMTLLLLLRREGNSDGVEVRGAATKSNFSAAQERLALKITAEERAELQSVNNNKPQ